MRLGLEAALRGLQLELLENPTAGDLDPSTGGLRKASSGGGRNQEGEGTLKEGVMDQKLFAELLESANDALEHAKGKRELRTTELPPPPRRVDGRGIRRLRTRLKMSQAVFARCLNVSTKLVQAWEADRRRPEGPALLLVRLVEQNPALVLSSWTLVKSGHARAKTRSRTVKRVPRTRQFA